HRHQVTPSYLSCENGARGVRGRGATLRAKIDGDRRPCIFHMGPAKRLAIDTSTGSDFAWSRLNLTKITEAIAMAELIQFKEGGVLVQVRTSADTITPTSAADKAVRVLERSLGEVLDTCRVVAAEFAKCCNPLLETDVESAELEVGFQFTTSGSIYVVEV